ncbi:MAG: hypothetical protein HC877_15320 [Thioploca sp.]|nr:hypothetical protein [Thioploca sp.]
MGRQLKIEIKETKAELKTLLQQPKKGRQKERVEALDLLKTQFAQTVQEIAIAEA